MEDKEDKEDKGESWRKKLSKLMKISAVYQLAFSAAMTIFKISKKFPVEEKYSLTDQIRRSSRSVCANLAEAWRKRRYVPEGRRSLAAFISKLNDCVPEGWRSLAEAAETQVWLKFAVKCQYVDVEKGRELYGTYNQILSGLVSMVNNPHRWIIGK